MLSKIFLDFSKGNFLVRIPTESPKFNRDHIGLGVKLIEKVFMEFSILYKKHCVDVFLSSEGRLPNIKKIDYLLIFYASVERDWEECRLYHQVKNKCFVFWLKQETKFIFSLIKATKSFNNYITKVNHNHNYIYITKSNHRYANIYIILDIEVGNNWQLWIKYFQFSNNWTFRIILTRTKWVDKLSRMYVMRNLRLFYP